MKTQKIKKIWKQFDIDRIVVGIYAYDRNENELFSYQNENGLYCETALYLHKLTSRKNSSFKLGFHNSFNAFFNR